MRWQSTVILAILLIAVGAFYYVWDVRLGPERERAESEKGRVWHAEPTDVVGLELTRGPEAVRLTREGQEWRLTAPVAARGDRGTVGDILTTIVTAKIDREIADRPPSLAEYGLDKPAAAVRLDLRNGTHLALLLGATNPTGAWVYAKRPDTPAVFEIPDTVLRSATRPLADLRDKTILVFTRQDARGLEVALPNETLAVETRDGTQWSMTKPQAMAADADAINGFLDKLQSDRIKQFVAEGPANLASYGLDHPVRVAVTTLHDKARATETLLLGRLDPTAKGVYAMRPGEASVFLLPEDIGTALPTNVAVLRNKIVVAFDREKLTQLALQSPRGDVTLARQKDTWTVTAPETLPADQVRVSDLLFKLAQLRALGFLTDDASGIPRYLARPEVRVTLREQGQASPVTLLLAPAPDRRGGQATAYAAIAGRGPVVLVDAKALTDLGPSLHDVRDRTLLSGLSPLDVARVRVASGDKYLVLERQGETGWRILEPKRGAAKASKVEDLLYSLRSLRWAEIAAPQGGDLAPWGLDKPALVVTLSKKDGGQIASVSLGHDAHGALYARTQAGPAIYAIKATTLGTLPRVPDDFQS